MKLEQASRKRAKIRLGLQGPSGSGKTYSALLLAYGLCGNWSKIVVIDTEHHSAELYAHLGNYYVLHIGAPFTPEKYVEAIQLCEKSGMEVIVVDSISHEWDGPGGALDIHSNMAGNSFTNWSKLTPRHNNFIQTILQSNAHIICTIRSKQDYVLQEKNGKQVPEKVGLKGITRDGMDYELTVVFDIDIKHNCSASKDRTNLFSNAPEFKVTIDTGKKIAEWCNANHVVNETEPLTIKELVAVCNTYEELVVLFGTLEEADKAKHKSLFNQRAQIIQQPVSPAEIIHSLPKPSTNGNSNSTTA
jgi:hypothetical protein